MLNRKMNNLLFAVVHHGQLLVFSSRLYSRLFQENVQLTIHSGSSWSASCFFLCVFPLLTGRGVDCLMVFGRLLSRGWSLSPFIAYCYLIGHSDLPWHYGWEDCSHFGYDLANIIWLPFCFRENLSSLLVWALTRILLDATLGGREML